MSKNYIFSLIFILITSTVKAQLTLQPGATWLFRSTLWGVSYAEKWEYQGTTGSTVSMKVTIKCLNASPGHVPCQNTGESVRTFTVVGDQVTLNGTLIADFSVQVGDLLPPPFAGPGSGEPACDSLKQVPATVIETGNETVNGENSRYYIARYLVGMANGDSVWATRKYSEYSWILSDDYWDFSDRYISAPGVCPVLDPFVLRSLVCYFDDEYGAPAVCNDVLWFDNLGVDETDISNRISVFPNPGTDVLNVNLPENNGHWRYKILSADGKQLSHGSLGTGQVEVSTLSSGMYFLLLENGSRTGRIPFVKQ